uniref:ANK_REP_REGION domain-containing protein n=1 Tax=Ascaris lumbricoides TaxID=6252 RepID=A0A0M3IHP0_ASCLU
MNLSNLPTDMEICRFTIENNEIAYDVLLSAYNLKHRNRIDPTDRSSNKNCNLIRAFSFEYFVRSSLG